MLDECGNVAAESLLIVAKSVRTISLSGSLGGIHIAARDREPLDSWAPFAIDETHILMRIGRPSQCAAMRIGRPSHFNYF
jgi:hypothetical protein